MNPETLRHCLPIDYEDHVARMNAAADAWEADYNMLSGQIAVLAEEHKRLCKRLEAAEKQIVTMREARIAYAVESYNAALAGEEP